MKIVFMGTPEFAVPVLAALYEAGHDIVAAVSQPDREKDKKGNILHTPVKRYSEEHAIKCLQFDKVSLHVNELSELAPDVIITAAFGQMLSEAVLCVAKYGVINVHASILPKYRGSSPIQSAILCGEKVTGVTLMKTELSMDTGDILAVCETEITDKDTCDTLSRRLSVEGAKLLVKTLPELAAGRIRPVPQKHEQATYCKKVVKSDGLIDWTQSAREIFCKIRAYNPWPIAYTYLDGEAMKIYSAELVEKNLGEANSVYVDGKSMLVACGKGALSLTCVQLPGKRALSVAEFLRGKKIPNGCVLTNG